LEAFFVACEGKNIEMVKAFLSYNPNIVDMQNEFNDDALIVASTRKQTSKKSHANKKTKLQLGTLSKSLAINPDSAVTKPDQFRQINHGDYEKTLHDMLANEPSNPYCPQRNALKTQKDDRSRKETTGNNRDSNLRKQKKK
jgi:hypothetical protein